MYFGGIIHIKIFMKFKEEIVENWLPRYTCVALDSFSKYVLLTNFKHYVELFADKFGVPVNGLSN